LKEASSNHKEKSEQIDSIVEQPKPLHDTVRQSNNYNKEESIEWQARTSKAYFNRVQDNEGNDRVKNQSLEQHAMMSDAYYKKGGASQ